MYVCIGLRILFSEKKKKNNNNNTLFDSDCSDKYRREKERRGKIDSEELSMYI
jgi:hypothetical protein